MLPRKPGVKNLKKELDTWFSRFIRWRDGGQCFTCERRDNPKKMHAGHFVPRQFLSTRYDEENCHCQCMACNLYFNGQPSAYAANLDRRYGPGTALRLESKRRLIVKNFPYGEFILKYKALAKEKGWE